MVTAYASRITNHESRLTAHGSQLTDFQRVKLRAILAPAMQCTLLIPHLVWPGVTAAAVTEGLALPALTKLLARARVERTPPLTPEVWMCRAFNVERQQDWPIAPLTLAFDGAEPGTDYWLRADPVHLKVTRDRLALVDNALFGINEDEAQSLVLTLNTHFAESGIVFHAYHPKRWYVKLSSTPALVTHSVSEVAGRDVQRYLPSGGDALVWHTLFNEIQMLLHEHATNEAREARGEPPLNSVWFWGGGMRPAASGGHYEYLWSDNANATAIAAAAGTPTAAVPAKADEWLAGALHSRGASDRHLITMEDLATAYAYQDIDAWRSRIAALELQWFAPLIRALREGQFSQITLVALGDTHCCDFVVGRADLLKVWKRPAPLSTYA
ncbi:MAG: 2,3-bisphosphoglycerate-independent phosphoglycerate mutase [Betaproteobacteria bacterium]|nr:2,3-bisphosphoglycerate-independent phosphoglycerate mutase [Betaproteobacteria bacterium]